MISVLAITSKTIAKQAHPAAAACQATLQNDADAIRAALDFQRAAKISFDLANQRMQSGNANVLLMLNAQAGYLQANIQVVQARAAQLADTAALFQSLGGGWWNCPKPPTEKVLDVGTGNAGALGKEHNPL